tara:strand:+ start:1519 stop:2385 length:867 start_codon:yes stop_codon:yes gene_type:complete
MKIRETLSKYYDAIKNKPAESPLPSFWYTNDIPLLEHNIPSDVLIEGEEQDKKYFAMYSEREFINDSWPEVTYELNELGYRTPSFNKLNLDKQQALVFGCSYTFGIGLQEQQIYTKYLEKGFSNTFQFWNFGCPGASNDFLTRLCWLTIPIFRPKVVIAQFTSPNRREYVEENGNLRRVLPNNPRVFIDTNRSYKSLMDLQNIHWDHYCIEKNIAFLETLSERYDFALIHSQMKDYPLVDKARDDNHPGIVSNKLFAVNLYKQFLDKTVYRTNREEDLERFLDVIDGQ